MGLWDVEDPSFLDNGGEVVNITSRPLFTPWKIPGTHFC
jgi:hypothetical protein